MKIPMNATQNSGWIAFPTQALLGFGAGFGLMTFMSCVQIEGKVGSDGKRKVTSFYRLQARRNPEGYLDVLRSDEVYRELYPRERPNNFDRNYVLEKQKEFKEIMALGNPYYTIYYSNKK